MTPLDPTSGADDSAPQNDGMGQVVPFPTRRRPTPDPAVPAVFAGPPMRFTREHVSFGLVLGVEVPRWKVVRAAADGGLIYLAL